MSEIAYRLLLCVRCGMFDSARFYAGCIIADGFATSEMEMLDEHNRWTRLFSHPV
jgi:hypothetical protein